MAVIVQGRIVYLSEALPDPQGHNPKSNRPYVVITPNESIKRDGFVEVVSISSSFDYPLADDLVELPFGKGCHTKLTSPSVAVCSWRACIADTLVSATRGFVTPRILKQILNTVEQCGGRLVRNDRPPPTPPS